MAMNVSDAAKKRGITIEQVEMLRSQRGLTEAGIEHLPEGALKRALRRLDYPDAPRARLLYRLRQSQDDDRSIPSQPLLTALRELDGLRLRTRGRAVAGMPSGGPVPPANLAVAPPPAAGLASRRWQSLGPGNIGGRTRSILIHPTNHDTMWAASVGGGIWRTDNGGQGWAPVDDFMANLAVTSIVMDPRDSNLIYAGTGEGFGNLDALRGGGIFRTTDGINWAHVPPTSGPGWDRINRLAISADGTILLAATNAGICRSTDPARAIWQTVLADQVADVKFHPANPNRAVVGSVSSGRAWFTSDGGATWTLSKHAGLWGGRVELCYARAAADTVYASVDSGGGEIWRSTDGGQNFAKRGTLNPDGDQAAYLGDQGWYDNVIWAGDPTDPDFVIVGGVDLWRSRDGGNTLVDISSWWDPRSAHADHHCIVSHPAYDGVHNRAEFFGNDGGVFRASDVAIVGNDPQPPRVSGWTELNNTYGVTEFYSGAGHMGTGVIVAGAQDNGSLVFEFSNRRAAMEAVLRRGRRFLLLGRERPQHLLRRICFSQYTPQHRRRCDGRYDRRPLHQRAVLERRTPALGLEAGSIPNSRRLQSARLIHRALRARPEQLRSHSGRRGVPLAHQRCKSAQYPDEWSTLVPYQGTIQRQHQRDRDHAGKLRPHLGRPREWRNLALAQWNGGKPRLVANRSAGSPSDQRQPLLQSNLRFTSRAQHGACRLRRVHHRERLAHRRWRRELDQHRGQPSGRPGPRGHDPSKQCKLVLHRNRGWRLRK